ncbi:MAG: four helix bundle protein [Cellulosilyticaceae bacterium]
MKKINVPDVSKLLVYQRSFDVSVKIYELTKNIKLHSIKDQVIRSSSSVFANISEGMMFKNAYPSKTNSFLISSLGSINETKTWMMYLKATQLLDASDCDGIIQECGEISLMLCSMINKIFAEIEAAKPSKVSTKSTVTTEPEETDSEPLEDDTLYISLGDPNPFTP